MVRSSEPAIVTLGKAAVATPEVCWALATTARRRTAQVTESKVRNIRLIVELLHAIDF
jgi:hypothetical protein